jgi:hypothetical protein
MLAHPAISAMAETATTANAIRVDMFDRPFREPGVSFGDKVAQAIDA